MKKTLISVCVFALSQAVAFAASKDTDVVSATSPAEPEASVVTSVAVNANALGDVDCNKELNENDAQIIAGYLLSGKTSVVGFELGNVNDDDRISVSDIAKLFYLIQHPEEIKDGSLRTVDEKADSTPVLAPVRPAEED